MKKNRQQKLMELVSRYEINTQEELMRLLRENGYEVTQATVSRDIRNLKIAKITTGKGDYRYVLPRQAEEDAGVRFNSSLADSIQSVECAQNLIVLRTRPGLANAVAAGIDGIRMPALLGCVAGDDTILVACRTSEDAIAVADKIRQMMRKA